MPLGVKKKSYWPVVYLGLAGGVPATADAWQLGLPVRLDMHVHPSKHVPCK